MGGKHRKSRYDSSSLSVTDTSDSSSSESSDSEVIFVLNHSHRYKSQHRINKLKHKKNKKHKKDRRYRSSSSDSSESCECKHKKHKYHHSKHYKEQKHHTNSNPYRTNNTERHINRNFDDWYCQDRIVYHSERDKFDDGYHYRDQDSYDRAPKADSHDRYYSDRYAIDRHYDRDRDRDGYYKRDNHDRGKLSVPSQHPDFIKHIDSNQQMINYHVLTSPVYLGHFHQVDSMSSNHNHVGSTSMASFPRCVLPS